MNKILVEVSVGELLDKISILEIKQEKIKAVSYTHLRAHETRHDLVCRLLLEFCRS